jgi:hypothetical protein
MIRVDSNDAGQNGTLYKYQSAARSSCSCADVSNHSTYQVTTIDINMRIFALAALAGLAVAHAPFDHPGWPSQPHPTAAQPHHGSNTTCISTPDASLIATSFGLTISNYTEALAVQLFTNNFTDQSDSVNTLIHEPGLQAKDVSTQAYEENIIQITDILIARILDLHLKSRIPRRTGSPTPRSFQDPEPLEHLRHRHHPLALQSNFACPRHQYR